VLTFKICASMHLFFGSQVRGRDLETLEVKFADEILRLWKNWLLFLSLGICQACDYSSWHEVIVHVLFFLFCMLSDIITDMT